MDFERVRRDAEPKGARHTSVVNLAGTRVDGLEKLVDFVVRHFLAQVRQDYPDTSKRVRQVCTRRLYYTV